MKSVKIKLGTMDMVKRFVKMITGHKGYFDLVSEHYTIDAKSIMGIFTLDITRELDLMIVECEDEEALMKDLNPFLVKKAIA